MFRRHVLAALATGIAAGDDLAVRAALRSLDPVARIFAKRCCERALIDAALATGLGKPSPTHVMQLAALREVGRVVDPADAGAVDAAYGQLRAPAMPRFPLWTLATALLAATLVASVALFFVTRPGPASRTFTRTLPPPSADAYRKGGVPLRDAAIDRLLTNELTDLVVEAGRDSANDLEARIHNLHGAEPLLAHGAPLAKAWDALLDVLARSAGVRNPTQRQEDELREAGRELTEQFAAQGLGYFVEARFKNGYAYVQAYRVVEVVLVNAGGAPRRVLSVRRLDKLDTAYAVLGIHNEDAGDPRVDLDRIDEHVATTIFPVLAEQAAYPLAEHAWLVSDAGKALAALAGERVRSEFLAALGSDASAAQQIAKLVVKRQDYIDGWRDHLERKKIFFVRTDSLFLPPDLLDQLSEVTPKYERDRVREIEDQLAELEAPRIHARVHDMVSAAVRRHEAQHAFDFDRDTDLRYPDVLAKLLGPPHDAAGEEVPIVRAARAELSGYLSEIANDPVTPHASLWHLARQAFTRDRWGTGEFYAAVVVLEGLGRVLGADVSGPTFHRGLDRERLAAIAMTILTVSDDKLRAAARTLWSELYGQPLTMILDMLKA